MRALRVLVPCLATVTLASCTNRGVSEVTPQQAIEERKDIPVSPNRDVDILFVIDNSASMRDEQVAIAANFGRFTAVLDRIEGGLPNIHLGVISSDVGAGGQPVPACGGEGDDGALQSAPRVDGCTPPGAPFISYEKTPDGTVRKNYTGTLAETFACVGQLGVDGCSFEQHLESMRRALAPDAPPANAGFLRPDAYLAVIFLADEDDCSAHRSEIFTPGDFTLDDPLGPLTSFRCFEHGVLCDGEAPRRSAAEYEACEARGAIDDGDDDYLWHPQVYVDFVKSLKSDPSKIMVAGILGHPSPVTTSFNAEGSLGLDFSCGGSAPGQPSADPAIRLKAFLDGFPGRNTFTSICEDDLAGALVQVANQLALVLGNPCFYSAIDTTDLDPDRPGLQLDCQVSQVVPGVSDDPLPRCDTDDANVISPTNPSFPCWHVASDPIRCIDFPTQLTLVIERDGAVPPTDAHVIAGCVVE